MRQAQFYFQNEIGQRVDLGVLSDVMFVHAKGLGITKKADTADLEHGFFSVINDKNEPQQRIVGDMVFTEDSYPRYRELVNWAEAAKELLFVYCPYGGEEYYRRVILQSLEKGVRGKWGQLQCAVSLQCLTPWYLPTAVEINFEGDSEAVMRYEYRYDASLIYGSDGGNAYHAVIPARGHVPASLRVRYAGASANFRAALVGQTSRREYGRCQIEGESAAGDVIELSTDPRDSFVRKNGKDWFDAVDITHEVFFRVPTDENCELQLEADNELTGTVEAQVLYYFRTV